FVRRDKPAIVARTRAVLPAHEWVACVALALLPVLETLVALGTWRVFAVRYALPAVLGTGILLAAALFRATRGSRIFAAILLLGIFTGLAMRTAHSLRTPPRLKMGG